MARVLFFGRLRDIAGAAEMEIAAATLAELTACLAEANPALGEALEARGVIVAVDKAVTRRGAPLTAKSEVAFMPPLSGG